MIHALRWFIPLGLALHLAAAEEPRWEQSYDAGFVDALGAYAGGSEIMHLTAHQGKLYAANGYWVDARWEIPPDAEKQSAQVLRLDAPDASWQVDLDCGKANHRGLRYMKGNLLKSVTFTHDEHGKALAAPQHLLVMAAGASLHRGGAVSVWVRNDETGTWAHTLVRHGNNAGGVRWVPRDLEVYRDTVTGVQRIFLSLGNPGIVSGVYDASLPEKIRWERHVEYPFPEVGVLRTRPLGLVQANGALHFSAGGSIFRRIDGDPARYEEVLRLAVETDPDVGGIRGLTTIPNPKGKGDSMLFLWAPGERLQGQIKRLDPDGQGGYTVHNEANLVQLMRESLGVEVRNILGAHNLFYPVTDPDSGETVHLLGFQGNLRGRDELCWKPSRYYAGGMYALRAADGSYTVQEVNNRWAPGKPVLVTPRAFCVSPFDDRQLYIGGHDANFQVSDDLAWIFRAPLDVALGKTRGKDAEIRPQVSPRLAGMDEGPVYELRIYVANEHRFEHLLKRFREHTDGLFRRHGMEPVGYWTRPEGTVRQQRTFYYILKHPSRYAAYRNWKAFTNSREWQRVLDRAEFQRLLNDRPEHLFMTGTAYTERAIVDQPGVYELRRYTAQPGKLAALHQQLQSKLLPTLDKQPLIACVGTWTGQDTPDRHTVVILLHHQGEWPVQVPEPELEGLARPIERIYLEPTDYSPLK